MGAQPDGSPGRKVGGFARWKTAIKWIIALAVLVGLYFAADASLGQWREQRDQVQTQLDEIDGELAKQQTAGRTNSLEQERERVARSLPTLGNLDWRLIFLSAFFYAAGLTPNGIVLHTALRALGQQPKLSTSIAAQLIGHVGKYVPGKAMVIVLRAGVLSRDGVKPLPATVSIFLETFLMMAVGSALAALIVIWLPVKPWISILAISIAVAASLPTLPPVMRLAAARIARSRDLSNDPRIGFRLFVVGWLGSLVAWALMGAAFAMLVFAIPSANELPSFAMVYAISTAAISLAIVVGFASLLPGGAGIRELVLTTILAVSLGPSHGLLAAVAARIVFLITEASVAGLVWLYLQRAKD